MDLKIRIYKCDIVKDLIRIQVFLRGEKINLVYCPCKASEGI